ncbi:MAG: hypothetical protein H7Y86_11095 [Rhizobacter sp.]|nr:hypothetical protein [Ferruginibacter sp.]
MKKFFLFLIVQTCLFKITAQNVGIGVANPQQKLHVGGNVRVDGFANCLPSLLHNK